jgi:hypothetical protein
LQGDYRPVAYHTPLEVESVVNHQKYPGGRLVVQAAGGVLADVRSVLSNRNLRTTSKALEKLAASLSFRGKTPERWWWDAPRDLQVND